MEGKEVGADGRRKGGGGGDHVTETDDFFITEKYFLYPEDFLRRVVFTYLGMRPHVLQQPLEQKLSVPSQEHLRAMLVLQDCETLSRIVVPYRVVL